MNSEDITRRMDRVKSELGMLIDDLRNNDEGAIEPICWNCAKAQILYLPGSFTPVYKPCPLWRSGKACAFEVR